jgi:vacuolar-type H+-ATPase subunit E/Vma4
MSYLVTDETFVEKVQDPRFSQIKTEVDAYKKIENPTEENQKDLFEKVKDDLRLLMMGDKDEPAYDLYSDFIQFSMKEVDNQYENGKTYLEKLEEEQDPTVYAFQEQDRLKKRNKKEEFDEFLRLLEAGVVAVNPNNNIKYIKKDGRYYVYEDQNNPDLAITFKQATGQDLPNPNQT